jgi:hypothetical protein
MYQLRKKKLEKKTFLIVLAAMGEAENFSDHPRLMDKLRSTEECLMRLAVQADKGYTPLKLNDRNMKFLSKASPLCLNVLLKKKQV